MDVSALAESIDIEKEFKLLTNQLEKVGLSTYEAKAYIALVAKGYGDAETIANIAGIPRTSAYTVLRSLITKGYVLATSGRPVIYRPEEPSKLCERIVSEIKEAFSKLESVHEIITERGMPQLVYTITGKDRVLDKIGELFDRSVEKIIISTPAFSEIRNTLGKRMENALKRDVSVTVITAPLHRVPEGTKLVYKKGLIATDVICDGVSALIASPDLNACGYTDNASLAAHLEHFLKIMMDNAEKKRE